jgi:hypothetical protein
VTDVIVWTRTEGPICACGHPTRDHTRRWKPPYDTCIDGCRCTLVRDPTITRDPTTRDQAS